MQAQSLGQRAAIGSSATTLRGAIWMPAAIYAVTAALYVVTLGARVTGTSGDAHYLYLAQSFLHGKLSLLAHKPPGDNDWAYYGGHWYVSFPPFPAVVVMPLVAIWGTAVWDRLFWALLAGLAPALLYVLLRALRETGRSERTPRQDLVLTALFAFGSPFYYTAVQGTVWFAAHVVAVPLIALYVLWSLGARRPLLAGIALALAFMTRGPTPLFLALLFAIEALAVSRKAGAPAPEQLRDLVSLSALDVRAAARKLAWFALPLCLTLAIAMWMNAARFDDPFEFGHSLLRIRWRGRIDTWGLFNYHFLARNLAVFLCALPWLSAKTPYLKISRHGLAVWVTTPQLLLVLWPQRRSILITALGLAAFAVALADLFYQNSGWVQFAYRFSLDYSILLFALLALGGRRFGPIFYALVPVAIAINLFGAITFDRENRFYDTDPTANVIFQPD
jgi:hypothetical protein